MAFVPSKQADTSVLVTYVNVSRVTTSDIVCTVNTCKMMPSHGQTMIAGEITPMKKFRAAMPYKKPKRVSIGQSLESLTDVQRIQVSDTHKQLCNELLSERNRFYERLQQAKHQIEEKRSQAAILIQKLYRGHRCRSISREYKRSDPSNYRILGSRQGSLNIQEKSNRDNYLKISLSVLHDELCLYANKLNFKPIPGLNLESYNKTSRRRKKIEKAASYLVLRFFRMLHARKEARAVIERYRMKKLEKAAERILRFFRNLKYRRNLELKSQSSQLKGVVLIQSHVRRFIMLRRYEREVICVHSKCSLL